MESQRVSKSQFPPRGVPLRLELPTILRLAGSQPSGVSILSPPIRPHLLSCSRSFLSPSLQTTVLAFITCSGVGSGSYALLSTINLRKTSSLILVVDLSGPGLLRISALSSPPLRRPWLWAVRLDKSLAALEGRA